MANERSRKEAIGKGSCPPALTKLHHSEWRADIGHFIDDGERKNLRIGQSGKEFLQLSTPILEDAVFEGADPEIAVIASERGDMGGLQTRVKRR